MYRKFSQAPRAGLLRRWCPPRLRRTMLSMKQRMTINVDAPLAAWLQSEASSSTNGNVSAYLEDLIRREALRESLSSHADFFAARPGWFDDLEAEHEAAWRSGE